MLPGIGEQGRLVGFDLEEVFAAFVHDDARGFLLAMQRVGRDGFAFERRHGGEELLRDLLLAALGVFLLIHTAIATGEPSSTSTKLTVPMMSRIILPSRASAPGKAPACAESQPLSRPANRSGSMRVSTS